MPYIYINKPTIRYTLSIVCYRSRSRPRRGRLDQFQDETQRTLGHQELGNPGLRWSVDWAAMLETSI